MKYLLPRFLLAVTLTLAVAAPADAKPWKNKKEKHNKHATYSRVNRDYGRDYDRYDRYDRYERARYERMRAERARYERMRAEQARYERARYERARYERARYERARYERMQRERLERIRRARNEQCYNSRVRDKQRDPRGWILPVAWNEDGGWDNRGGRDNRGVWSDRDHVDCGYGNDYPRTVRNDPRRYPPSADQDNRIRRERARRLEELRRRRDGGNPCADRNNRQRSDDCDVQDARDWLRSVQIGPRDLPGGQRRYLVSSDPTVQAAAQRALKILQISP